MKFSMFISLGCWRSRHGLKTCGAYPGLHGHEENPCYMATYVLDGDILG